MKELFSQLLLLLLFKLVFSEEKRLVHELADMDDNGMRCMTGEMEEENLDLLTIM